ncbi:XRE family transcriptional regulator [Erwinia sp. MMLR14_017]|uniref:helix-turn-helix domain-containing protein n=1 Tax=Erwinia sp. MMLR14_017 TaxID=3093842 RepID=UPI0029907FED|nr:XRE family transcriptional regulator [Erwinia sp. MMLR14_017]MDW8845325.1 XRE family transcriptional regulator [Erwinia sp. MMLR14_017]
MKIQKFESVWVAISPRPEEAESMKVRSQLVMALNGLIEKRGLNTLEAAALLGVSQPRISELAKGKIQLFSVDKLINMLAHAGMQIGTIEISESVAA